MTTIQAAVELHDKLNPKIWNSDNTLKTDVHDKLMDIVDEFAESIDIPLTIIDAHIVGSNASYNYTSQSDLDLHCIVNYARLDADPAIVEAWMQTQKRLFNENYDITIRDINVEIYVENVNSNTVSNGIYSLFNDEWIKVPQPIEADIDEDAIDIKADELEKDIQEVLKSEDINEVEDMIDSLYLLRKNGLATGGEFSTDNQVFKELRNRGQLEALRNRCYELKSDELSIAASQALNR